MRLLLLSSVVTLSVCNVAHSDPYVPGTPGVKWTEKQAEVIRDKLIYLWDNKLDLVVQFDFNNTAAPASHTDYLYDPQRILSTVDCDWKYSLCAGYWSKKRIRNIAFGEPKAIR